MGTLSVSKMAVVFTPQAVGSSTTTSSAFSVTNTTGSDVTITGVAFTPSSPSYQDYALSVPAVSLNQSSFSVAPNSTFFPVTISNGSSQAFDVTFSPARYEGGTDTRSVIAYLLNSASVSCTINIGGGVTYPSFDVPQTHPIMGLPATMNLSDIDSTLHIDPIYLLGTPNSIQSAQSTQSGETDVLDPNIIQIVDGTGSSVPTTGDYVDVGANSVQVLVRFESADMGCDLDIYANIDSMGDVLVGSWTDLTNFNVDGLFIGNLTGVALGGAQLKAATSNEVNGAVVWVAVFVLG